MVELHHLFKDFYRCELILLNKVKFNRKRFFYFFHWQHNKKHTKKLSKKKNWKLFKQNTKKIMRNFFFVLTRRFSYEPNFCISLFLVLFLEGVYYIVQKLFSSFCIFFFWFEIFFLFLPCVAIDVVVDVVIYICVRVWVVRVCICTFCSCLWLFERESSKLLCQKEL